MNIKNKKLFLCLISSFVWGIIGHSYMFLSSNFSHDSVNAFYAGEAETKWKLSLGRYLVVFLRYFFGKICLPWAYGVASLIIIGFITYFIVSLFKLNNNVLIVLSSGILTINITVIAMTATYLYELPFDMLAGLLSVIAVYYMYSSSSFAGKYAFPAILFLLSMAIYQSYICVAITLITLYAIYSLYNKESLISVIIRLIKGAATVIAGMVLYFISNKIVCLILKVENIERFDLIGQLKDGLAGKIVHAYLKVARRIILPFNVIPKWVLLIVCTLVFAGSMLLVLRKMIKDKTPLINLIVVIILFGILPLLMNILGAVNYYSHDLMLYSIFVMYPFLFKVVEDTNEGANNTSNKENGTTIFYKILVVCMGLIIWNNILLANTCYVKKDLENKAMLSCMTRVIDDLDKRDDYKMGETPVVFDGYGPFPTVMEGFEDYTEITGMYFKTPVTPGISWYFDVYKNYLAYTFNYPIVSVDEDTYDKCHEFVDEGMPAFPSDGYIQNYEGVIVVNLGY